MERLNRWLQKRALRSHGRASLEEALLGGHFLRYCGHRLLAFALVRMFGALTHVLEFTFLLNLFRHRAIIASVAVQNATFLVEAFWWGCLEVMRSHLRRDASKNEIVVRITAWLTWSLRLGVIALVLPVGSSIVLTTVASKGFGVLDAYLVVCGLRLGVDIVVRTYYSGIYALQRVRRPLWSILLTNPLGLLLILVAQPYVGAWCFPIGLAITVLVSRGLAVYYTTRMYKLARLPLPRFRLRNRRKEGPSLIPVRVLLHAGFANLSTRLGSMLVLAAVITPLLAGDEASELLLALHAAATLLAGAGYWTQIFYHDFKRLEDEAYVLMQGRLHRALLGASFLVGGGLWLLAALSIAVLLGSLAVGPFASLLLPVFLATSYLSTLQVRDFVRGQFSRLIKSAMPLCAALLAVVLWGNRGTLPLWSLGMTGAVMSGVVVLWVSTLAASGPITGVQPSLLKWVRALVATRGSVRVGRASTRDATPTHCKVFATHVADTIGGRGASVVLSHARRVLWFERGPSTSDSSRSDLVKAGAGKLQSLDLTDFQEGGRAALLAAIEKGFVSEVSSTSLESSTSSLVGAFREAFGDRALISDLCAKRPATALSRLPPQVRRAVWLDAAREARQGSVSRQRSGYEVSSFRPAGEIRLLFVIPRTEPIEARRAWRDRLRAANWTASASIASP